jgi:hypothetical protein
VRILYLFSGFYLCGKLSEFSDIFLLHMIGEKVWLLAMIRMVMTLSLQLM